MQQSLQILSLSNEELAEMMQEESLENPLLEIENSQSLLMKGSLESFPASKRPYSTDRAEFFPQDHLPEPESFKRFLLKQKEQSFYSRELKDIIELLISYLDERGYLRISPEELAFKNKTPVRNVLRALKALQGFEPSGVGARNLEECLLIQMRQKKLQEPSLKRLIQYHLELLKDRKYPYIAKELGVDLKELKRLAKLLKNLQPNPAFNFSFEPTVFVRPDIYIYKEGASFSVFFNRDSLPALRLSSFYLSRLSKNNSLKQEEKKYFQSKKKSADFFIQALYQREETIKKTALFIIKHQSAFFHKGFQFLKPLKMMDLARELNVHTSTVSRAVSNKYAHTPHGAIALRDFFIKGPQSSLIDSPSIKKIKLSIQTWIEEENPEEPLSDEDLKNRVEKSFKVDLSRRRIAQYRSALNIPQKRIRKLSFLYDSEA